MTFALAVVMGKISLVSTLAEYHGEQAAEGEVSEYGLIADEMPENDGMEELISDAPADTAQDVLNRSSESLPSAYMSADLRALFPELTDEFMISDKNLVTPVKYQGNFGLCYAFAAIGAMETSVLSKYDVEADSLDLSELQAAYYNIFRDSLSNPAGTEKDTVNDGNSKTISYLNKGGNDSYMVSSLMRWVGASDESASPYTELENYTLSEDLKNGSLATAANAYLLRNWEYLPGKSTQLLKQKILEYGSGVVWVYYDSRQSNYDSENDAMFTPSSLGITKSNHEGIIVGWDDDYPKENFRNDITQPEHDGAFLVKNSWGQDHNRSGYYWLSYEDTILCKTSYRVYFYDALSTEDAEDINHQYDGGIWTSYPDTYTYTENGSTESAFFKTIYSADESVSMANIFTAGEDSWEKLESVAFYTQNYNLNCHISIYRDVENNPTDGTLMDDAETDVSYVSCGYHTVSLSSPVTLKPGEKFSVVVTLSKKEGGSIWLPYETTSSNFKSEVSMNAGESFFKTDGEWTDLKEWADTKKERLNADSNGSQDTAVNIGNFRIKAFADKTGAETEAKRLGGCNRYETCTLTAKEAYPDGAEEIVLVTGENFPDALSAASYAGIKDAPILLTYNNCLSNYVRELLESEWGSRLEKVTVIGLCFNEELYLQLEETTGLSRKDGSIEIIGGGTRYETALAVCRRVMSEDNYDGTACIVATGCNAPDALSMSPWAYAYHMPILLADKTLQLSEAARNMLNQFDTIYIAGAEGVVNDETIRILAKENPSRVIRLKGDNRYQTSMAIAEYFLKDSQMKKTAAFSSGEDANFPDALSAGCLMGKNKGAVILVSLSKTEKNEEIKAFLTRTWSNPLIPEKVYAIGSNRLISDDMFSSFLSSMVSSSE